MTPRDIAREIADELEAHPTVYAEGSADEDTGLDSLTITVRGLDAIERIIVRCLDSTVAERTTTLRRRLDDAERDLEDLS